eukprot:TRINITY_DN106836_c0_g1_i1.p1 TRINITY_DN106836_c0_g1~~TRINITY_DN106836_c0_g1_i1.p1  ORF type:complete len:290 (-),score=40.70 TRINITY_DN106836_c0_g1_i1:100-969(-)
MSYSTYNRYLEPTNKYAYERGGGPSGGTGMRVWWPDYGPGTMDFSAQDRSHPTETIFDKNVAPAHKWSAASCTKPRDRPADIIHAAQIRHPAPAREAMLRNKEHPDIDVKLRAHEVTERQGALRRAEMRQRRIDAWAGEPPIRLSATALSEASRSRSDSLLNTIGSSQVSREVYQRNGYLVGRSKEPARRSKPLSLHSMLFAGDLVNNNSSSTRVGRRPRKYEMQWKTLPEKKFVFDPKTFLPVPRGGWDAHEMGKWPDVPPAGRREFAALPFDAAPVSPSAGSPKAEV